MRKIRNFFKLCLARILKVIGARDFFSESVLMRVALKLSLMLGAFSLVMVVITTNYSALYYLLPLIVFVLWGIASFVLRMIGWLKSCFTYFPVSVDMEGWELIAKSVPFGDIHPDIVTLSYYEYYERYGETRHDTLERINAEMREAIGHDMFRVFGSLIRNDLHVYYLFNEDLEILKDSGFLDRMPPKI